MVRVLAFHDGRLGETVDGFEPWQTMMLEQMDRRTSRQRESDDVMAESSSLYWDGDE